MADRVVSIGERGEDLLPLLYRLDALTAAQYARLCPQKDPVAQRNGAKSRGNPHGGRLSSRAGDIKRWSAEGRSHAEIAGLLGVGVDGVDLERGIPFSWRRLNPAIFISEVVYDEWIEEGCGDSCEFAGALMVNFILEAIVRPLIEGRGPADEHELVVVLAALDWLE